MTLLKMLPTCNSIKNKLLLRNIKKYVTLVNKKTDLISKLINKSFVFSNIKNKNRYLTLLLDSFSNEQHIIINYLFRIKIFNNNIMLNITNNTGNTLIYTTSGILNYKGSHKTNKHLILKIINNVLKSVHFFKNHSIGLHFNGNVKKFNQVIITLLKTHYKIHFIKTYNLTPHNGCRPKKLKRLKHFSIKKVF